MGILEGRAAILQALLPGDSYGLELVERVAKVTGGLIRLPPGRIYPILRSLEGEGLVETSAHQRSKTKTGRPRRYYRLTSAGARVARREARAILALLQSEQGKP